ncbi:hypothetical protein TELCIR_19964 [Teladorsagia circumcincta]|uniref:Uncharacterized protein n=1 Tax=Teladorsagia circumcincta TaxID=45464 RepID=A0A2G9TKX3_TELCI|nr:hypothetical protein TELCIR_19964 [Teladorsagia circumcincta]
MKRLMQRSWKRAKQHMLSAGPGTRKRLLKQSCSWLPSEVRSPLENC